MADPLGETIVAPATAPGQAGIAVLRVSGPAVDEVVRAVTGQAPPEARRASLRRFLCPEGAVIDEGLLIRFEPGASYTGEAMAEFQCHGGRAVVAALLAALTALPGCRLAEPGEFTRRALEAGRIDLAGAEALGDLLAAETELQRRQAMQGMSGALQRLAEGWRDDLLRAAALVEVTIDWADEEVPEDVSPEVAVLVGRVRAGIAEQLALSDGAERLRQGFEVAILGAPNAGKSSVFNVLAGREAAITSEQPGTTRDVLELRYDLNGLPVTFLDTAGMREASDAVEAEGMSRARMRAEGAALRIFLRAPDIPAWPGEEELFRSGDIRVWNKSDLQDPPDSANLAISALTAQGVQGLLREVEARLADQVPLDALVGHKRQRDALTSAIGALAQVESGVSNGAAELVAEDLRKACIDLERLLGRIETDDVLDAVFARFCLGK